MPLRVFCKSVQADELILLLGRWLVFTPVVPFVPHYLSFAYERFRKLESGVVEFLCHTLLPLPCVFRNGSSLKRSREMRTMRSHQDLGIACDLDARRGAEVLTVKTVIFSGKTHSDSSG